MQVIDRNKYFYFWVYQHKVQGEAYSQSARHYMREVQWRRGSDVDFVRRSTLSAESGNRVVARMLRYSEEL